MTKTIDTVVRVRDQASRKFGRIGTSATTMGSLIKRAAVGVGFYFGARQVASIIRYGAEFEKTMSRVKALTQATEIEHRKLTETAKRLGERTAFTAKQVADGMSYLALAGFETDEIIASMPATLNLAAAGQIDLAQATDITAKIMRGMGLDVDELDHAVDVLAKGFTTANTDLVMLGEAFSYVGPLGRTAGKSLEELVATIQVMSNAGIQASMAGTSMRQILGVLSGASESATKKLSDLGIITRDASGKLRPMADIVDSLNEALAKSGPAEKTGILLEIFGKRAGPGMAALLNEGSQTLREYEKSMVDAAGTAKQIAETQLDNVAGELTKIGSVSSGIILELYGKIQVWLKDYLARFRAGLTVMGVVINNMGLLWDIFWTKAKLTMTFWWEDTKHLFGTMVPEFLKWFARNWSEIFTDLWNGTKAIFVNMAKNIGNFFKGVWSWLKGEGYDFKWTGLLEGFEATLEEMPKIAKRGLSETEKALRSELDALKLEFAQKIVDKFDEESAEVTTAAKKSAAKVLDFEEEERKKTARAAKAATLQAVEARFLTFAPGAQLNYQKVTAEGVSEQVSISKQILDETKKAAAAGTASKLKTTTEKIEGTSRNAIAENTAAIVEASKKTSEPKIKMDFEKEFRAVTADVARQNAIATQIYARSIIQKSIADAYAKKEGKTVEDLNAAEQVSVSKQILAETIKNANDGGAEQVSVSKQILAETIKNANDGGAEQVSVSKQILAETIKKGADERNEKQKLDNVKMVEGTIKQIAMTANTANQVKAMAAKIAEGTSQQNATAANTSRQVAVSEQILSGSKQDKSDAQREKQLALTGRLVAGSNQHIQLTKEMLVNIQELNESQGQTVEITNFK